ncbi:phage major capsid protein [Sphingomonas floccifaciens]|uniref:Phage major capsid protein n=1 Tax=Sphingomonas floccifaciens TaxID=1844115 RepID=A0ABW4NHY7_9SPHN
MKTSELIEQRAAIVARMNDAHGKDDQAAFDTAATELRAHDAKLERARAIDAADRSEQGRTIHGDAVDPEIRSQSVIETIRYKMGEPCDRAKVEREQAFLEERAGKKADGIFIATELFEMRATQTTGTSAAIVPTSFRPDLFTSALTNQTVMQALGATVLTGLTGNVVIPRETGSPNVGWVAEDQALPTGNATFDSLTLSPHHVGAITELSRQLIMQSSPAADAIVRQMLSRNIALEIDRAAINGTGADAQPTGILNAAGIPTEAFATDLFTTTANMIGKADIANVGSSRGFVTTNGVKGMAAKTKDGDGYPLGISTIFHGEPVQFSNQVPNNLNPTANKHGLVYGDWADFLIGIWSQLDILVNPYAESAYSKGNILIRAMATVDFGVRRPASFVKATGVAVA